MKQGDQSGSCGAAREERVWVTRCFGLGAADASIVVSHLEGVGNRSSLLQKNRGYKPLLQKNRGYKPLLQKITIPFPEEIHVDGGVSSLHPFLFFYC